MTKSKPFGAEGSTVSGLLNQHGQGFYVPIYQRSFTWTPDDVDQLLEDLLLGTAAMARSSSVSMFIGSVILLPDKDGVDPPCDATPAEVLHVIDGQQRLTTLALVCAELFTRVYNLEGVLSARSDVGTNDQTAWLSKRLKHYLKALLNTISLETDAGEGLYARAPRLIRQGVDQWGDAADNVEYESDVAWYIWQLLQEREAAALTGVTIPPERAALAAVLRPIRERLDRLATGKTQLPDLDELRTPVPAWAAQIAGDKQPLGGAALDELDEALRLVTFCGYVQSGLMFIDVRAQSEENAFALFEPLNTTGQMLTPLETLKPGVIAVENGVKKYMGSHSRKHLDRLDVLFPPTDEGVRKGISDFIGAFALADTGQARIGKSLQPQRRYLRERLQIDLKDSKAEQRRFIKSMREDAEFFAQATHYAAIPAHLATASELDRLCFQVLQESKHTIVFPLLARYQADTTAHGRAEYQQLLRAVTAFFTLWRSSRATTGGIDDLHRHLMSVGHSRTGLAPLARWNPQTGTANPGLPPASDVKKALLDLLSHNGKVGSKKAWVDRMTAQNLYDTQKTLSRFLLLAAHDDAVAVTAGQIKRGTNGCLPTLTLTAWERLHTLEHVAPQNLKTGDATYDTAIYDDDLVGHIGNLTLLPTDLNNLVENRTWPQKRQFFEILGEADAAKRVDLVKAMVSAAPLRQKHQDSLLAADFMQLTTFIAKNKAPTYTKAFVEKRGKVLGGLAWERLSPLLT